MLMKTLSLIVCICLTTIHSKITISNPPDLEMKVHGPIKASYSLFGSIPYGYYTVGRLYYDPVEKNKDYACEPLTNLKIDKEEDVDRLPIIMVDRGDCSFVTKTRNVQQAGGRVAIIVNNNDDDISTIHMIDDGTGSDIFIPALLISKKDGKVIQEFFEKNKNDVSVLSNIIVAVEFHMKKTEVVEYQFFFSSSNVKIYKLMEEFKPYHNLIAKYSRFVPHYISHESTIYMQGHPDKNIHCISNGKYCTSPKYNIGANYGKVILLEDIRQKCIYNIAYKGGNGVYDPEYYWQYMIGFYNTCINVETPKFDWECSLEVSDNIDFEQEAIRDCIKSSFKTEQYEELMLTNDNQLLEEDYEVKLKWSIKAFPEILVNNKTLSGAWTAENLFEAICAGMLNPPSSCDMFTPNTTETATADFSFWSIMMIILVIIALNVVIIYICKKYIMKRIHERIENVDINSRINNVVSSYLALRDTK